MSNNNGNLFMVLKDGRFNNVIIYICHYIVEDAVKI